MFIDIVFKEQFFEYLHGEILKIGSTQNVISDTSSVHFYSTSFHFTSTEDILAVSLLRGLIHCYENDLLI